MIGIGSGSKGLNGVLRFAILFLSLAIAACGNGGGEPTIEKSTSGALAFKAVWPERGTDASRNISDSTENTSDVCTTFGIETITATVLDASGTQQGAGSWPCDTQDHKGTINGIPEGGDYRVTVKGRAGGHDTWSGQATDITVNSGKTTMIDKIVMHSLDHTLNASVSDGGRIEPSGSVAISEVGVQVFTFIPDNDYEVDDVVVDGVSQGPMDSYTFSDVRSDRTIYVSFKPTGTTVVTHTISATAGGGGTIVPHGQVPVLAGNDQVFNFYPGTGNSIVDVFVDGASQGAITSYTFNDVAADHTIRVAFDTTTYTINTSAGAGGRIEPAGPVTAAYGTTAQFTITADQGYYLSALTVNGQEITPQGTYTFPEITADGAIEAVFSRVKYVAAGTGGDGTSWATAFTNLGDAMAAAVQGDEIWVKAGTYLLDGQVSINKAVEIYGGFDGTELYRHQRDWQNQPAIFDGQDASRCFFISADSRIDGFIIQNGDISGYADLQGGGLYIINSSPTIANCTIRNNTMDTTNVCSGGAIFGSDSAPYFENCHFQGNLLNCEMAFGGALLLENCDAVFRNCSFVGNEADGAFSTRGGGIDATGGTLTIENSLFRHNRIRGEVAFGGAISCKNGVVTIDRSQFVENEAGGSNFTSAGGAINLSVTESGVSDSLIRNTLFIRNSAAYVPRNAHGGAISNYDASPDIINCSFLDNHARGSIDSNGGAISNLPGNPTITNTVLWGNRSVIFIESGGPDSDGEGMQLYDDASSGSVVTFSDIDQDGYTGDGNLRQDPQVDAFGHLRPGSPCIDQGNDAVAPTTDIDGDTRPQGGRSDLGADEFVDVDGDRLPDYWEVRFGLDADTDDADADLDGDGLSNLEEYQSSHDPSVANVVVNAVHRGWYDESGFHDGSDNSTRCGMQNSTLHAAYFIFDLPPGAATVTRAVLRLELTAYSSRLLSETFRAYDVITDPAALEASGSGQTAIFDDLGDGKAYSEVLTISPADVGLVLNIPMSADALVDIGSAGGGSFAVGFIATYYRFDEDNVISFSAASENRVHQLVLTVE